MRVKTRRRMNRNRKNKKRRTRRQQQGGSENCIFVNWGPAIGLGNQLFIYSAAVKVQKETGKDICLFPVEDNQHSTTDYRPMFKHAKSVERTPDMMRRLEAAKKLHERDFVFYGKWDVE